MESKLRVKNFGPIKDVELLLKNVNVFIGPQATGKSALAKIYNIFKAPRKFFFKNAQEESEIIIDAKALQDFKDVFNEYNISSFLNNDTIIEFDSELHNIIYENGLLNYEPKLLKKIKELKIHLNEFENNKEQILNTFNNFFDKFISFTIQSEKILNEDADKSTLIDRVKMLRNIDSSNCFNVLEKIQNVELDLSTNTAIYIPAERTFSNIIKKSALNLILNNVPIPKHILSFGAELEKLEIKEFDLDFIQKNLRYKIVNGEDIIYINDKKSITLSEAASGIQSVVPLLSPILNRRFLTHRSFIIEEPELNLFPVAQYELIQLLESNRRDPYWEDFGTIHTYTTHSPYILSALNNLLYANKVSKFVKQQKQNENKQKELELKIKKIVRAEIDANSFNAYQIKDGFAKSIFNRETGLIDDNYIDDATDKINDDFDELMELMK